MSMRQPDTYWPYANFTIDHTTNTQTITFTDTPEAFVAKLVERNIYIYVMRRCCSECFYTPESPMPQEALKRYTEQEIRPLHRVLDCLHHTIKQIQDPFFFPDMIVCYGYYYQHWHENQYLQAAKEAGRIRFVDGSDLPTLAGSGFLINTSEFFQ